MVKVAAAQAKQVLPNAKPVPSVRQRLPWLQKFVGTAKGVLHNAVRQVRVSVPAPPPVARVRLDGDYGVGLRVAPPRVPLAAQVIF